MSQENRWQTEHEFFDEELVRIFTQMTLSSFVVVVVVVVVQSLSHVQLFVTP